MGIFISVVFNVVVCKWNLFAMSFCVLKEYLVIPKVYSQLSVITVSFYFLAV